MVKENLTVENIRKDLEKYTERLPYIDTGWHTATRAVGFVALPFWLLIQFFGESDDVVLLLLIPLLVLCLPALILETIDSIVQIRYRKKARIAASSDKLLITVETLTSVTREYMSGRNRRKYEDTFLNFDSSQSWRIQPYVTHYMWSKDIYLSGRGLDNSSLPGDQFYVVRVAKYPEVAYIYNKKFFTFKDYDSGYIF